MELNENRLKSILSEQREEYQRYMGILKEDFDSKLNLIGEQFGTINAKLDSHSEMIGTLVEDVQVLKTDVQVMKTDIQVLKTDVQVMKTDVQVMKTDVQVLKTDVQVLKTDVQVLKTDVQVMKTDVQVLKTDVQIIKTDVQFIKGALKKKVDYEEFETLVSRVAMLEAKIAK